MPLKITLNKSLHIRRIHGMKLYIFGEMNLCAYTEYVELRLSSNRFALSLLAKIKQCSFTTYEILNCTCSPCARNETVHNRHNALVLDHRYRYQTEMMDAGMPMPALVSSMPMPSYDNRGVRVSN
jgi:hypothetical protein